VAAGDDDDGGNHHVGEEDREDEGLPQERGREGKRVL
jgi:hypothetical protein